MGDLRSARSTCSSPTSQTKNSGMMIRNWRNKSALQRFADDLIHREQNLKSMIVEQEAKIEETKGDKFKANVKSDDFLMRQFFSEFIKACR